MRKRFLLVVTMILLALCLVFASCGESKENSARGNEPQAGGGQSLPEQKDDPLEEDKKEPDAGGEEEKPDTGGEKEPDAGDEKEPDTGGSEKEEEKPGEGKEEEESKTPAPSDTLTFERSGEGYFVTGDAGESESIIIPAAYQNLPVIGIKESAFAYSKHKADITSVTIPDTVVTIEKNAFYSRHELREVKIGEGSALETIENYVFSGCRALEEIHLPAGLKEIGDAAFNNCGGLNTITVASANTRYSGEGNNLIDKQTHTLIRGSNQSVIPSTVTQIGDAAFRRAALTELTIPVSVVAIGKYIIQDSAITKIIFAGTSAGWDAVEKSKSWNLGKTDVAVTFSSEGEKTEEASVLVAYFSCTNNTKGVAQKIAQATGGTLYEIVPEEPYTAADLDYGSDCRANREQNDSSARPAIQGSVDDMSQYDVVYLGYPIWWGKAPKIIETFLESYDFSDKTIIPFCTSGSSGITASIPDLKAIANDATWLAGERFSGSAKQSEVEAWIEKLQY